jgi:hypothetical protein
MVKNSRIDSWLTTILWRLKESFVDQIYSCGSLNMQQQPICFVRCFCIRAVNGCPFFVLLQCIV